MDSFEDSLREHPPRLAAALQSVIDAGRAERWPEYRARFAALREGLLQHLALKEDEEHAQIRRHLEMLGAAAPERDPEGCVAALEQLVELLGPRLAAEMAPTAPPAVDLRGLQPPEPMVRIFQALERAPREPLRVILPHEPVPLYNLLLERGYTYAGSPRADGGFELLIERS
jgi:hypothetical protein